MNGLIAPTREIERDRSGRPDPSTGKAASRYRDTASGSGRFRGSYCWHETEGLDVKGRSVRFRRKPVGPDKPPRRGRSNDRAEVRPADSTRRTGEPSRGKRSAAGDSFWGDMGSMQRERQPSMQREDQTDHGYGSGTNSSKSAVNHLSKSVVRDTECPKPHATFCGNWGGRLPR